MKCACVAITLTDPTHRETVQGFMQVMRSALEGMSCRASNHMYLCCSKVCPNGMYRCMLSIMCVKVQGWEGHLTGKATCSGIWPAFIASGVLTCRPTYTAPQPWMLHEASLRSRYEPTLWRCAMLCCTFCESDSLVCSAQHTHHCHLAQSTENSNLLLCLLCHCNPHLGWLLVYCISVP